MYNDIHDTELPDIDDLLRMDGGTVVCKRCGKATKKLYSTDKGYMCSAHQRLR